MQKIIIATAGLVLMIGAANAGSPTSSDVDNKSGASSHAQQSAGTVGAMDRVSDGVATSTDDVKRQQDGASLRGTDVAKDGGSLSTMQSPGTVGASPGFTSDHTHR